MSIVLAKLTPVRCPCGDEVCQRFGFAEGAFDQGNGFPESQAREIARRYESEPRLRELLLAARDELDDVARLASAVSASINRSLAATEGAG